MDTMMMILVEKAKKNGRKTEKERKGQERHQRMLTSHEPASALQLVVSLSLGQRRYTTYVNAIHIERTL